MSAHRSGQVPDRSLASSGLPAKLNACPDLVVDDEPALCELLARALRDAGFVVVKACSGLPGRDLVGSTAESFDLVVTDSRMPGMSGTEFIHRLREQNPARPGPAPWKLLPPTKLPRRDSNPRPGD